MDPFRLLTKRLTVSPTEIWYLPLVPTTKKRVRVRQFSCRRALFWDTISSALGFAHLVPRPIPWTGVLGIARRSHMSTFLLIVVAAAVGALVLGLILKVRLRDQEVWEELVDPKTSSNPFDSESSRNPDAGERYDIDADELEGNHAFQDEEEMTTNPLSQSHRSVQDPELRRSSRIERPVSLVVLGTNRRGEIFQERTSAVSINLHGCRYSSRHEYAPEGWVTLQVTGTDGANSRPVRARVRSVFTAQTSRELCQVGVELETPGNIWGIHAVPEDWQRLLGSNNSASRSSAAVAPAHDSAAAPASFHDRQAGSNDRRAEVTVFPGPPAATSDEAAEKEGSPTKAERVVITAEQLLQALQGKLQLAAEKSVQVALSSQLDDAVKAALGRIEDGWKDNVRQTEQFSAARMAEAHTLWDNELHSYRDRAEDVARRIEALTALSQQALADSQKFVERFANETAPQLQAQLNDSISRAHSNFEAQASELSSRHLAGLNEDAQRATGDARSKIESALEQARSFTPPAASPAVDSVSQDRFDSQINSFRTEVLGRFEARLAELQSSFVQQHEVAQNRINDLAHQFEGFANESRQARSQNEQSLTEVRSLVNNSTRGVPQEQLHSLRAEVLDRLEARLAELHSGFTQQTDAARNRTNDLARQLEGLALESRQARSQNEQNIAEVRSLVSNAGQGVPQEQLNSTLNSSRDQIFSHLEWRLGEVSAHYERLVAQAQARADQLSQQLEKLSAETRDRLNEARQLAERAPRELSPQDLASIEQSVGHAAKEFETVAARVSDRQLIRLMEQKQVVSHEVTLELEARASEARALLQKASNSTIDDFRRRVEAQANHVLAEATERASSSLASLDAENRAAVEARRRTLEADVARAAEQSTADFRSGIKAFLYSCLVAAVSAVDEHAQTTLAGLSKEPSNTQRALEAFSKENPTPDDTQFPPKAATP